jgi:hypothetical protein
MATNSITGGRSTTTGPGPLVLSAVLPGHRDIRAVLTNGMQRVFYARSGNQYMLFLGTYTTTSGTRITVNTVYYSSNSNLAVVWTGETINIVVTLRAEDYVMAADIGSTVQPYSAVLAATTSPFTAAKNTRLNTVYASGGLSHLADGEAVFMGMIGDSNASGGSAAPATPPVYNPRVFLRMMPTLTSTYVEDDIGWYALDPNDPMRTLQGNDAYADLKTPTMQALGGVNTIDYAAASAIQVARNCDVYLYKNALGGMVTGVWAPPNGLAGIGGWNGYNCVFGAGNDSVAAALADMNAITGGSKTFVDIVICSLGANDINSLNTSGPAWYTTWRSIYDAMVSAGWYNEDYSQYFHIENVNNSNANMVARYKPGWTGYALMLANTNDRVQLITSIGAETESPTGLHYTGDQYDRFGITVANKAMACPPAKPAVRENTYLSKLLPVLGGNMDQAGFSISGGDVNTTGFAFRGTNLISTAAATGGVDVGFTFDSVNDFSTLGDQLYVWKTAGVEAASIYGNGGFASKNAGGYRFFTGYLGSITLMNEPIVYGSAVNFKSSVANGAGAVSYSYDTNGITLTAGAYLAQWKNNTGLRISFAHDGGATFAGTVSAAALSSNSMLATTPVTGAVDVAHIFDTTFDFSTLGDQLYVWKTAGVEVASIYGNGGFASKNGVNARFQTGYLGSITLMNEPIIYGASVTYTSLVASGGDAFSYKTNGAYSAGNLSVWKNNTDIKVTFSQLGAPGFWGVTPPTTRPTANTGNNTPSVAGSGALTINASSMWDGGLGGSAYPINALFKMAKENGFLAA